MTSDPRTGPGSVTEARLLMMAADVAAELARKTPVDSEGRIALCDLSEALAGGRHMRDLVDDWALRGLRRTADHIDAIARDADTDGINNGGGTHDE